MFTSSESRTHRKRDAADRRALLASLTVVHLWKGNLALIHVMLSRYLDYSGEYNLHPTRIPKQMPSHVSLTKVDYQIAFPSFRLTARDRWDWLKENVIRRSQNPSILGPSKSECLHKPSFISVDDIICGVGESSPFPSMRLRKVWWHRFLIGFSLVYFASSYLFGVGRTTRITMRSPSLAWNELAVHCGVIAHL